MLVYVRGAGDIATGVAARLVRSGVSVVMADIAVPTCIRRTISFCEAIRLGEVEVEGIRARLAQTPAEALAITEAGDVAVVVDPQAKMLDELKPAAVVDAILAKRNLGTTRDMAPAVIAVGPGFTAPVDCDAVVETMRGHFLGRVITQGSPQPNTGVPGIVAGYGKSFSGNVPSSYFRFRQLFRQSDGNTPTSSANVENTGNRSDFLQHPLHQFFRFGTGNKHPRSHPKSTSQETGSTLHILYGLKIAQTGKNAFQFLFILWR